MTTNDPPIDEQKQRREQQKTQTQNQTPRSSLVLKNFDIQGLGLRWDTNREIYVVQTLESFHLHLHPPVNAYQDQVPAWRPILSRV